VHALEQVKPEGERSIALGPLNDDAVVQLAADILAAKPDHSIVKQLAEADGSPFLVETAPLPTSTRSLRTSRKP
jgi:hypothetical protein